ncbi:MAG: hypothetical protein JKY24_01150 [Pseudomonadales bacterium]|nr:hypothetical protein [Pseudomonadales bacterium]
MADRFSELQGKLDLASNKVAIWSSIVKITLASDSEKPYYLSKKGVSPKGCFIRDRLLRDNQEFD